MASRNKERLNEGKEPKMGCDVTNGEKNSPATGPNKIDKSLLSCAESSQEMKDSGKQKEKAFKYVERIFIFMSFYIQRYCVQL